MSDTTTSAVIIVRSALVQDVEALRLEAATLSNFVVETRRDLNVSFNGECSYSVAKSVIISSVIPSAK